MSAGFQPLAAGGQIPTRLTVAERRQSRSPQWSDRIDGTGAELAAIGSIPDTRKQVEELIYRERSSAPGELKQRVPHGGQLLGKLVESNLETIGDPARQRELELDQQLRQAHGDGEPTMEPSVAVRRF